MKVTLTVEADDTTGEVTVTGPVDNLGFCYSLLEMAKDAVRQRAHSAKLGIIAPHPGEVDDLTKRRQQS